MFDKIGKGIDVEGRRAGNRLFLDYFNNFS
jgi:hypothetical protein